MVEQKPTNIQEIFRDSILRVPEYQRDYSWKRQHVRDLLRDIRYMYTEEERREEIELHYFGTIVLHQVGKVPVGSDEFTKYDVVDGQQRLTTISLIIGSFIEAIQEMEIEASNLDTEERRPERLEQDLREDYILDRGKRRLQLHTGNQDIFEALVEDNEDPNDLEGESSSERHLINAKKEIREWLKDYDTGSDLEFYRNILSLKRIINNYFEVTQYKVESVGEAGRIFETLNDRGRTLTVTDKIKSYLVYCANRMDDDPLAEQIYEDFGEVIRNITRDGTESELTRFMREHWRMFSGEIEFANSSAYEVNDLHRRIKDVEDHAKLERDNAELKDWIEAYLNSLVECSEAYKLIARPKNINVSEFNGPVEEIKRNLTNIHRHTSRRNVASLLISVYLEFGFSPEYRQVTSLLESYAWRAYQVCRAHRDYGRRIFRRYAFKLYYLGDPAQPASIFKTRSATDLEVFDDRQDAFETICYKLEDLIGNYGNNQQFQRNLRRRDVFNGDLNEDGWNGFRDQEKILYFLYEYEHYLRSSATPPLQTPDLDEWITMGLAIEHIWPDEVGNIPDEYQSEHKQFKDSFGNLALRHPDNVGAGYPPSSAPYEEKYEEVYSISPLNIMESLPEEGWNPKEIMARLDVLVDFAIQRWGVTTAAIVPVAISEDIEQSEQVHQLIRSQVEERFDSKNDDIPDELNNLPAIKFDPDYSPDETDLNYDCDNCGSISFSVDDDGETYVCECGEKLEAPSFAIQLSDYTISD